MIFITDIIFSSCNSGGSEDSKRNSSNSYLCKASSIFYSAEGEFYKGVYIW